MIPRHWTFRYIRDRLREMIFQKRHPQAPWLTPASVRLLQRLLRQDMHGLEFGSGRSTAWLAARLASLLSVEDNEEWYRKVTHRLEQQRIRNVDYRLVTAEGPEDLAAQYLQLLDHLPDDYFDFILVDSEHHRDILANAVLPKLKPGGFLVVDNCNWFLPSASRSPHARKPEEGAASPLWQQFADAVQNWRCTWTSSGVTDTAFFFKP